MKSNETMDKNAGQINNSVVWTIVGILAIIALLIFIISALGR